MIWLTSLITLFASSVQAQTHADGIAQLKQFLSEVQSAEGEFEQQQLRPPRAGEDKPKVLRKSSGRYVFKRPGLFLWETQKPFTQKVISNGQQILVWDSDLNQLSIRPIARGLAASPAALLFGEQALENHFDLISGGEKRGMYWVELKPKDAAPQNYVRLGLGFSDGLPRALELHDNFGVVTIIGLGKMRTNINVDAKQFKFEPPKNAEILQLTQ
jgi:outer membrane lipoprotein carrier protein